MICKFKEFRENLGLTQKEIAKDLNCSIAYIKKIEAGERKGSIAFWNKIQNVYKIENSEVWRLAKSD